MVDDPADAAFAAVSASASGDKGGVAAWLEGGGHADTSVAGLTLLTAAAGRGHQRVVELLLQSGAAVDLCSSDDPAGFTALMHACVGRHPTVVRQLLFADASLSSRSASGLTALELLREASRCELLRSAEFIRLMDCTRAIIERARRDEDARFAHLVPSPELVVSAEDSEQLEQWGLRVKHERASLEALAAENARRGVDHQTRFAGIIGEASGDNALDRVSAVAKRLSRARVQRNNEMGEWQSKGKHQARPLLLAKQALKLRRPLLRFLD